MRTRTVELLLFVAILALATWILWVLWRDGSRMMRLSEGFQTTGTLDTAATAPPGSMGGAQIVVIGPKVNSTDTNNPLFISNSYDTNFTSLTWNSYGTIPLIGVGGRDGRLSGLNAAGALYSTRPGTLLSAAQWNQIGVPTSPPNNTVRQLSRDGNNLAVVLTPSNAIRLATQNIEGATTTAPNWNAVNPRIPPQTSNSNASLNGVRSISTSKGRAVCVGQNNKLYYTADYITQGNLTAWFDVMANSNETALQVIQAVLDNTRVGIIARTSATAPNMTYVADLTERGIMAANGTLTASTSRQIRWFNINLNAENIDMLEGRMLAIASDNRIYYKRDYRLTDAASWTRVNLPDFTNREVFLYDNIDGYNQNDSACKSLGAEIATLAQVTSAQTAGGHWCTCGFVTDKSTHYVNNGAEFPTSTTPVRCSGISVTSGVVTTTPGVKQCVSALEGSKISGSQQQRWGSFMTSRVHCFGVKPKEGADAKVRPFRTISTTNTRWNMSQPLAVHFLQDPNAALAGVLADAVAAAEMEATEAERQRGIADTDTGIINISLRAGNFNETSVSNNLANARNAASNAEAARVRAAAALTIATTNAAIINSPAANTEKTRTETAVNRATTAATAARTMVTSMIERIVTFYADRADNHASSTELDRLIRNAETLRSTTTVSNVTDTTVTNIGTILSDATTRQTNATTAFNDATRHADTINTTAGNASKERARQAVTRATATVTSITTARDAIVAMRREKTVKDSADDATRYANEAEAARDTAIQFRDTVFRGSETRETRDSAVTSSRTNSNTSEQKRLDAVGASTTATQEATILNTPTARSERDRATNAVSRAAAAALAADAAADEAEPIGVELKKLLSWSPNLTTIHNTRIRSNVWRGPILSQADSTAGLTMTLGVNDANRVGFWRPMNEPTTDDTSDQIWIYTEEMELINLFSRKCLDTSRIDPLLTTDGLSPEMFTCAGRSGQKWFIDSESRIRPINNKNLCLTLTSFTNPPSQPSGNTPLRVTLGQPIQLKTCTPNGNKMQRFFTTGGVPLAGRRIPMPGVGAPNASAPPPIPEPVNREGFRDKYIPREMSLATRYTDDAF